jgi:hypothetical protein
MTVIFPSIREGKISKQSHLSVQYQTLKDIEIIENRDPNLTPGEAANKALDEATGELITWAYDDDVLLLPKCEILAMFADKYLDYDVFYSGHITIDEKNKFTGIWNPPHFDIDYFISTGNFISTIAAAVRREKIGDIRFRLDYSLTDEFIFFYDLYKKGLRFKQIGVPLVLVRNWDDNRTLKFHDEKLKEHERIRAEFGDQFYRKRFYKKEYLKKARQAQEKQLCQK